MISQWPLVLACTCLAWAAGLFGSLGIHCLAGKSHRSLTPAWALSVILLVAGGFGLVMRTQHWERLFNSFTHLASTMTQEFICIVVFAVVAVAFLVAARRNDGEPPLWASILAIVAGVALTVTVGRALVIPSRPALDVAVAVLTVFAGACALGPATMACIEGVTRDDSGFSWPLAFAGSVVNAVTTIASLVYMQVTIAAAAASKAQAPQFSFDPTNPTASIVEKATPMPFVGGNLPFSIIAIVAALGAVAVVAIGRKKLPKALWGGIALVLGIVAVVCVRVVAIETGAVTAIRF